MLENYRNILFTKLVHDEKSTKVRFILVTIILALILANLIYLNYNSVSDNKQTNLTTEIITSSSTTKPSDELTTTTTATPTKIPDIQALNTNKTTVRDYFIPLGSGTGQEQDWKDISGAQATVDFAQYSPIKEIRFEISVNVPTGNETVSVRLFNATDKHPVWYSEVTTSSNATSYLTSSPIIYDFGAKLYQVQMKTQLQYPANLTQSRIHVVSK